MSPALHCSHIFSRTQINKQTSDASERTNEKKKCPKDICFVGLASGIMMLSLQKFLIIIISFVHATESIARCDKNGRHDFCATFMAQMENRFAYNLIDSHSYFVKMQLCREQCLPPNWHVFWIKRLKLSAEAHTLHGHGYEDHLKRAREHKTK